MDEMEETTVEERIKAAAVVALDHPDPVAALTAMLADDAEAQELMETFIPKFWLAWAARQRERAPI